MNVCPGDIFWIAEPFTTKIGVEMYHFMSQIVFQKDWFAVFKVKVTVKDHVTKHDFLISSLIYALTVRVIGAPQMISQPVSSIFPCSPLSSGTWRTPVHSLMLSSDLFLCLPCLVPPFTVPCKIVLARPDERETWPCHCSLRLFTMVKRSSCGTIGCRILTRTSSLVTWSLYEVCSILR